jgi:endonuclease/exonuclease/phosphatase family metal-dependent hydrolase
MKFASAQNFLRKVLPASAASILLLGPLQSSAQQNLPMAEEEVHTFLFEAEEEVLQTIECLVTIPDEQKTSMNMIKPWNQLGQQLVSRFSVLTFLSMTDLPCKMAAVDALQDLKSFLSEYLFDNAELQHALLMYAQNFISKDKFHTPYEHYELQCLLGNCEKADHLMDQQSTLDWLKESNAKYSQKSFQFLKGHAAEKMSAEPTFTVLTLNTCFVPGNFPYLFGGVIQPWEERVASLAEKVMTADADIVCLQEVHAEDASYALYEMLKDRYAYFYVAIGPRVLGFSLDTLGLPSGLFVASKYPLEHAEFSPFSVVGLPMNYGFFDFIVKNDSAAIGHVYVTHLQSLDFGPFPQIRAMELKQILEKMQADLEKESADIPFFLCGDLNMPFGSQEPGLELVQTYFHDDFNMDPAPIGEYRSTCTDYFTNFLFSMTKNPDDIDPNFRVLDYALLLKREPRSSEPVCQRYEIHTDLLLMNDIHRPESAISDHHGLLTKIQIKTIQ